VIAAAISLPTSGISQEVAVTHCAGSCPYYNSAFTAGNSKVVIHHLYAAGLNRYSRRADWVAYRLSEEAVGIASLLPREWQPDRLAGFSEVAELADLEPDQSVPDVARSVSPYGGSSEPTSNEQNRVHLAPMTSFANTPYWSEINYTSNMLPMPVPLRLGPWLRLEQALNGLVTRGKDMHVVTGPIFYDGAVPGSDSLEPGLNLAGYYKVIVEDSGYAAFIFPQQLAQNEAYCEQLTRLEKVEELTGLELFPDRGLAQSSRLIADLNCTP
jgi:endonuclease G